MQKELLRGLSGFNMKVLVLGIIPSPLTPILKDTGCEAIEWENPITIRFIREQNISFAVSYRYRHIVKEQIIEYFKGNIINLHISLLPWNRGADPNLWSFLENTPKGVSIHYMDEGVDTGDIITQREFVFDIENETLATTYSKLNYGIIELFRKAWPDIISGKIQRQKQTGSGSEHKLKDKKKYEHLLIDNNWDTPVRDLIGKALTGPEKSDGK